MKKGCIFLFSVVLLFCIISCATVSDERNYYVEGVEIPSAYVDLPVIEGNIFYYKIDNSIIGGFFQRKKMKKESRNPNDLYIGESSTEDIGHEFLMFESVRNTKTYYQTKQGNNTYSTVFAYYKKHSLTDIDIRSTVDGYRFDQICETGERDLNFGSFKVQKTTDYWDTLIQNGLMFPYLFTTFQIDGKTYNLLLTKWYVYEGNQNADSVSKLYGLLKFKEQEFVIEDSLGNVCASFTKDSYKIYHTESVDSEKFIYVICSYCSLFNLI